MTRFLLLALAVWCAALAAAQAPVPKLEARITDRTGTLTREQNAALERMLQAFEDRKGSQIAVLMVATTAPEPIEQYALRAAEQWKIGRKNVDDGALLVVAKDDRALRIEVGYGLEGALTDAAAKRIISDVIVPRFREGDFFGGLSAGLDRMMRVIDGEPLPEPARARPGAQGLGSVAPALLMIALAASMILRAVLGRLLGAAVASGAVGVLAWLVAGTLVVAIIAGLIAFFLTLAGGAGRGLRYGSRHGGFGGIRGGGFGGGGFGGGGFRGGGGGFGGGGASGRW